MLKHPSLQHLDHRPFPIPSRPWAMAMRWQDLLFMHWPVPPEALREVVPGDFDLDEYDGACWVGVVPFYMTRVRPRFCPAVPGWLGEPSVSRFAELNVRTYVTRDGMPGVYFFSLDAASRLAVRGARFRGLWKLPGFGLPYFDAAMRCEVDPDPRGWTTYQSRRTHYGAPPASFSARYRPRRMIDPVPAAPGTLEHFLTERYCLYSVARRGRPVRGHIHHEPWPLRPAHCEIEACEMTAGLGFELPTHDAPLLHYAKQLDVVAWLPERI
ncbi:MAG: DUF2071 domain-containing protein [Planctomycetota bacterium]